MMLERRAAPDSARHLVRRQATVVIAIHAIEHREWLPQHILKSEIAVMILIFARKVRHQLLSLHGKLTCAQPARRTAPFESDEMINQSPDFGSV